MAAASGHVFLPRGKSRSTWYAKYRLPDGRQVKRKLGIAWEQRGETTAGHHTRRSAEAHLREILADAPRGQQRSGVTFADACEECSATSNTTAAGPTPPCATTKASSAPRCSLSSEPRPTSTP